MPPRDTLGPGAMQSGPESDGGRRLQRLTLFGVQEGVADDVLADVGRGGQAVQPVEQLHARDVMLLGLLIQLIPKHRATSGQRGDWVTPSPALLLWQASLAPAACSCLPLLGEHP